MRSGSDASSAVSLNESLRFFGFGGRWRRGRATRFGGGAGTAGLRCRTQSVYPPTYSPTRPPPSSTSVLGDDVVEERAVVAHDEQRSGELEQQLLEQVERLDVEIVRRLVEHEQVERSREQPREQQPVSLAARQRAHRRARAVGREEKILQIAVHVLRRDPRDLDEVRAVGDAVEHALLGIELLAQLVEVRDLEPGAEANRSRRRRKLAEQEAEQRRLAGAVGTDEADAVAARDRRR